MQAKIDAIAAFCNKLAQELSKKQVKVNQNHIQSNLPAPYLSIDIPEQNHPLKYQNDQTTKTCLYSLAPSDIALEMVQSALKISSLYQTRSRLALSFAAQKNNTAVKIEQQVQKEAYVQSQKEDFDQNSKMGKRQLKKIVIGYLKTNPLQVKKIISNLKINKNESHRWLRLKERIGRHLQLKEQILKKSTSSEITMNEFKKLARKIYTHKLFRPTDAWCHSFIRKHKLEDAVNFPIDE